MVDVQLFGASRNFRLSILVKNGKWALASMKPRVLPVLPLQDLLFVCVATCKRWRIRNLGSFFFVICYTTDCLIIIIVWVLFIADH